MNNYKYNTIDELMSYVISILNNMLEFKSEIIGEGCTFSVGTLDESRYLIHYKMGENKLEWYKYDDGQQDKKNIYVIPSIK